MAVTIGNRSRLMFKEWVSLDGVEYWELDPFPAIPEQTDDIYIQITERDRIDLLAYRYYKDPTFWWVIALANELELVPTDLLPGATIRIPSPTYILGPFFETQTTLGLPQRT